MHVRLCPPLPRRKEYLPEEMLSEEADHGMTGRTGTEPGR
jgi:hypothetical protein